MRTILLFGLLTGIFTLGCKKDSVETPKVFIDNREFKLGSYQVTTDSGIYQIVVEKLDSTDYLGNVAYYTKIYNLFNNFPVVYGRVMDIHNEDLANVLQIGPRVNGKIQLPYYDVNGKSWWITSYTIAKAGLHYGRLSNDTLRMYIHLNNYIYYERDSIPMADKFLILEGIKVK